MLPALQGEPRLTAIGNRLFGAWLGAEGPGFTNIGYGYSLDGGFTWVNELGIPEDGLSSNGVHAPPNAAWSGDSIHLLTDHRLLQHFTGTGFRPVTWTPGNEVLRKLTPGTLQLFDATAVAADPSEHALYVCAVEGMQSLQYRVLFRRSLDDGATWQTPIQLSSLTSNGSSLAVAADGTVYVSWVDYALGQVLIRKSTDHGASFAAPLVVSDIRDNLGALPIGWRGTFLNGERGYPWYGSASINSFAPNFPALAVDRSSGGTRGALYLVWTEHAPGTVAGSGTLVSDQAGNDTFATAQLIPLDADISGFLPTVEFGNFDEDYYAFDAVAGQTIWITGSATVAGRRDGGTGWHLYETLPTGTPLQMDVQSIFDPALLSANVHVKPSIITLPHTGRYFIQFYAAAANITYDLKLREYHPTPGSVARDMRDIVCVHSNDGGATWSPMVRVNHDPPGWDQALPNVAVDGHGWVYVGWYDKRGCATGDSAHAYASVSRDGGQTFGADLQLSSMPSRWVGPASFDYPQEPPGALLGERIGIAAGDDYGIVAWTDLRDWPTNSDVYAARIVDVATATDAVSDLSAEPGENGIQLGWLVNDARSVDALRIYRASEAEPERALGEADFLPTANGHAEWLDASAQDGLTYTYRLRVQARGRTDWLGPITVEMPARITALAWRAAWPNPFGRQANLRLAVPRAADGTVRVYDVQGKEVRTLVEGHLEAGERVLAWDGRDAAGNATAAGIYFIAAQVGGENAKLRVARLP